jgi:hypothetical protein
MIFARFAMAAALLLSGGAFTASASEADRVDARFEVFVIEAPLGQAGDARGKVEPDEVAQGEVVIADAAAIGVMGEDAQVGLMIERSVNDIGGLAEAASLRGPKIYFCRLSPRRTPPLSLLAGLC